LSLLFFGFSNVIVELDIVDDCILPIFHFHQSSSSPLIQKSVDMVTVPAEINGNFLRWWFYQHGRLCAKVRMQNNITVANRSSFCQWPIAFFIAEPESCSHNWNLLSYTERSWPFQSKREAICFQLSGGVGKIS
jgi:hypothetical protein